MPVPLIALLAASLHEASTAGAHPAAYARSVSLLARAVGGSAVTIAVDGDAVQVNGMPVPGTAPGALLVARTLVRLGIGTLHVPAQVDAARWREVVELLGSAPALYPDAAAFSTALSGILANASVSALTTTALPLGVEHESEFSDADEWGGTTVAVGASDVERSPLSNRLQPIVERGRQALEANDDATLAEVLLELGMLDVSAGDAVSVRAERRRLAPPRVLEGMARSLPDPTAPVVIGRALKTLGADAADAIVEAMRDATNRVARRAYAAALSDIPEADETILAGLTGSNPQVVSDLADVAGRRAMARAVPILARLLKHHDEEVRTAAWHALEQIGTPDAQRALAR
jgi:hypothetical protein